MRHYTKSFDEIIKVDKKAAVAAAQKAGTEVSQMDLDSVALSAADKAKEEKAKNTAVDHAEGYFEARHRPYHVPLPFPIPPHLTCQPSQ